jgi:MoaA/NifB/PqqE/SkfB family radical SAM enzyme
MPKWNEARLLALINTLAARGTRHLQWTGGEVTVMPGLEQYIAWSRDAGMSNSISTNGLAGIQRYLALVDAGVSHFSISLDHPDPETFNRLTQTSDKLPEIKGTIAQLCKANTAQKYKVVVNAVLTRETVISFMENQAQHLRDFLHWCVTVGVDDFKFLPTSTEAFISIFPQRETMDQFIAICIDLVPEQYKFFFYRLSMMQRGGHGLHGEPQPHICYHSLDDRAYDSLGVYPCIIHLREGGQRLYAHDESETSKRRHLENFLQEDRTQDPVCQKFCFDVYRALNKRVATLIQPKNIA